MKHMKQYSTLQLIWLFIGGIFLPLLSLYLASKASLFYENLTYVGNLESNRTLFMIWGIMQSLYYCLSYYMTCRKYHIHQPIYVIISILLTLISIIAFLLPYQNHSGDIISQLHVYGSMLSCIATFALVMKLMITLSNYDYHLFQKSKMILMLIFSSFTFCIILLGDISTLSELFLLDGLNYLFLFLLYTKKAH